MSTIKKALSDPIESLRANVSLPFEQAHAMPPDVYTSKSFLDHRITRPEERYTCFF